MKKIRIGNTFEVRWGIYSGEGLDERPYDLTGRDLHLFMSTPTLGMVEITDFYVNRHILHWVFEGKEQNKTGTYTLTLVENKGENGMRTVDECNAFSLVKMLPPSHHCDCDCDNIQIETIEFKSKLMFASTSSDVVKSNYVFPYDLGIAQSGQFSEEELTAFKEAVSERNPFMIAIDEHYYPANYKQVGDGFVVSVSLGVKNINRELIQVVYVAEISEYGEYTTSQHSLSLQEKLISGVNIATINGHSLLDGGDIVISGVGGDPARIPDDVIVDMVFKEN